MLLTGRGALTVAQPIVRRTTLYLAHLGTVFDVDILRIIVRPKSSEIHT